LDRLPFYEYHYLVKDLTEHLKAEKEANDKQSTSAEAAQGSYKQPKMPTFKQPSFKAPKM
tara:strand:- start:248 stop:427 length:180 start_codon:yes stop_codon:yes gene_type:complete